MGFIAGMAVLPNPVAHTLQPAPLNWAGNWQSRRLKSTKTCRAAA